MPAVRIAECPGTFAARDESASCGLRFPTQAPVARGIFNDCCYEVDRIGLDHGHFERTPVKPKKQRPGISTAASQSRQFVTSCRGSTNLDIPCRQTSWCSSTSGRHQRSSISYRGSPQAPSSRGRRQYLSFSIRRTCTSSRPPGRRWAYDHPRAGLGLGWRKRRRERDNGGSR